MSELVNNLSREAEAARSLVANIRDAIGDDEDAQLDMIEGETSLKEVLEQAAQRLAVLTANAEAIKKVRDDLAARAARFERQDELLRTAICAALADADLKKVELSTATLSRAPSPPKVMVTAESEIPAEFWKRSDPTLDKRKLGEALKDGAAIPGATLSNQAETLRVRFA